MWNYKCDKWFTKPLWGLIGLCHFLIDLSWMYAHYRNGWFVTGSLERPKNPPDLFFKRQTFWWCVKSSWSSRHHED